MNKKPDDSFEQFIYAQNLVYEKVVAELSHGKKQTHWMWFIFPQLTGLGNSDMARMFALHSFDEARRYGEHKILGERLRRCTWLVNEIQGRGIVEIFEHPDNLKFHSSMTLFTLVFPKEKLYETALTKYFEGKEDMATVELLQTL